MTEQKKPKLKEEDLSFKERFECDAMVWQTAINTQVHFNELLIKMRTAVISVILAAFGSVIITLGNPNLTMHLWSKWNVHVGIVITLFGVAFVLAHFVLDYFYYFRLLLGAVKFAEMIDEKYADQELFGLTKTITKSIPQWSAHLWLLFFYLVPLIAGVVGILAVTCIYPIQNVQSDALRVQKANAVIDQIAKPS